MKKVLGISVVAGAIFVTGCSEEADGNNQNENNEVNVVENSENEENNNIENDNNNENEENNNDEEEKEEEEETTAFEDDLDSLDEEEQEMGSNFFDEYEGTSEDHEVESSEYIEDTLEVHEDEDLKRISFTEEIVNEDGEERIVSHYGWFDGSEEDRYEFIPTPSVNTGIGVPSVYYFYDTAEEIIPHVLEVAYKSEDADDLEFLEETFDSEGNYEDFIENFETYEGWSLQGFDGITARNSDIEPQDDGNPLFHVIKNAQYDVKNKETDEEVEMKVTFKLTFSDEEEGVYKLTDVGFVEPE